MNLGEMRAEVRLASSLTTTENALIDAAINLAQVDFCDRTSILQGAFSMALAPGVTEYDIPTLVPDFIRFRNLYSLSVDGTVGHMDPNAALSDFSDDLAANSEWSTPTQYAVMGGRTLLVSPAPDGLFNLNGGYVRRAVPLVADADVPEVPEEYHLALVYKALDIRLRLDRQPDATEFRDAYEVEVARCLALQKRTGGDAVKALRPSSSARGSRITMWDRMMGS